MNGPKYIATQWESYYREVVGPRVTIQTTQYKETKKAFYAGAAAFFSIVMNENDKDIMQQLNDELVEYAEQFKPKGVKNVDNQ